MVPHTISEFEKLYSTENLNWIRITGTPRFDYPIDYSVAVLGANESAQRIDFLSRWEPNSYGHYHRHLGINSVLVLEGEHNIIETIGYETVHRKRTKGFAISNMGGDVHQEFGGSEGALVFFRCYAVNGKLFEVLDKDGTLLNTATMQDFITGSIRR